jgi:hypothetical protein
LEIRQSSGFPRHKLEVSRVSIPKGQTQAQPLVFQPSPNDQTQTQAQPLGFQPSPNDQTQTQAQPLILQPSLKDQAFWLWGDL